MLNNEQLNDAYELPKRRIDLLSNEGLNTFFTKIPDRRLSWYNAWLDRIGEGLITVGKFIRERN